MSRTLQLAALGLIAATAFIYACHEQSAHTAGDVGIDVEGRADAEDSVDVTDDARSDPHDGKRDVRSDADADTTDAVNNEPLVYDASLWLQENPCSGEVGFPEETEDFVLPDSHVSYDPIKTRADVVSDLGGSLPRQGWGFFFDVQLRPDAEPPWGLFSEGDSDVNLHAYIINGYDRQELGQFRLSVLAMVDYAPAQARYRRWNPERTETWLDTETTGFNLPIRSDVEIVDITLPASLFAEERMYEIALFVKTANVQTSEQRKMALGGEALRFGLYNGGYSRPNRPCAEPRLGSPATEVERTTLIRAMAAEIAGLFFEGAVKDELRTIVDVAPGETKRFYLSLFRNDRHHGPNPTVVVPLLQGKPIGPTWWVTQGEDDDSSSWDVIDARKSFEVTFPDEPGIYEVQVATWEDPYKPWRTRDGERVREVSQGSSVAEGSNVLRFRVADENERE